MNESKTPRTDALLANPGNDPEEHGWIEHARQLELELGAVTRERDSLRAAVDGLIVKLETELEVAQSEYVAIPVLVTNRETRGYAHGRRNGIYESLSMVQRAAKGAK